MRKIGLQEIEEIALGVALLGAGGGDPYVGKLVALGAVRECGAVSLIDHDDLDKLNCWRGRKSCVLARLCTRPDRRRQGIGFRLTGFALEQARRQGCDSVRLLADVRSATAGRLYERAGFERRAEAELYGHRYYALEYLIVPLETL